MNLEVSGQSVERVSFDYAVTLLTDGGAEIRIETEFSLHTPDGATAVINPETPGQAVELLLAILHQMITTATAADDTGTLVFEFVHGARVEVSPSSDYEAWTFAAQDGVRVVAQPRRRAHHVER